MGLDINPQDIDRIIEMAWEDRTPFEAIEYQFGLIKTRLTDADAEKEESLIDIEGNKIKVGVNSAVFQSAKTMIPLGRPGTPEEAAGAIYMFCIPESNYVTGQILMCHGGGFGY